MEFEKSYALETGAHRCDGIMVRSVGLAEYMSGRVRRRHHGSDAIGEMVEEFPDLRATGFGNDGLAGIRPDPEPWRVGESFSECFLEDHRGARLPYPIWHDQKNQDASQTGADLVGYCYRNGSAVFLFGEVKTSAEDRRPPSTAYNMKGQLQDLELPKTSLQLVIWLGFKARTERDRQDFGQAIQSYNKCVFKIVGVLIRDTAPDRRDLEGAFTHLTGALHHASLEMLAIYLPISIDRMPKMMDSKSDHG